MKRALSVRCSVELKQLQAQQTPVIGSLCCQMPLPLTVAEAAQANPEAKGHWRVFVRLRKDGKRFTRSLETKDPATAARRAQQALEELERFSTPAGQ